MITRCISAVCSKRKPGFPPAQYRKAERAGEQPSDPQEEDACTPNIDKNRNS